jgi:hypothetical protein
MMRNGVWQVLDEQQDYGTDDEQLPRLVKAYVELKYSQSKYNRNNMSYCRADAVLSRAELAKRKGHG